MLGTHAYLVQNQSKVDPPEWMDQLCSPEVAEVVFERVDDYDGIVEVVSYTVERALDIVF